MAVGQGISSGVVCGLASLMAEGCPGGVAFVHELTATERAAGVLAGDDDLSVWTVLADGLGGLDLATGGTVQARALTDLPLRLASDRPAGRG